MFTSSSIVDVIVVVAIEELRKPLIEKKTKKRRSKQTRTESKKCSRFSETEFEWLLIFLLHLVFEGKKTFFLHFRYYRETWAYYVINNKSNTLNSLFIVQLNKSFFFIILQSVQSVSRIRTRKLQKVENYCSRSPCVTLMNLKFRNLWVRQSINNKTPSCDSLTFLAWWSPKDLIWFSRAPTIFKWTRCRPLTPNMKLLMV